MAQGKHDEGFGRRRGSESVPGGTCDGKTDSEANAKVGPSVRVQLSQPATIGHAVCECVRTGVVRRKSCCCCCWRWCSFTFLLSFVRYRGRIWKTSFPSEGRKGPYLFPPPPLTPADSLPLLSSSFFFLPFARLSRFGLMKRQTRQGGLPSVLPWRWWQRD